jgi:hypothetical protein
MGSAGGEPEIPHGVGAGKRASEMIVNCNLASPLLAASPSIPLISLDVHIWRQRSAEGERVSGSSPSVPYSGAYWVRGEPWGWVARSCLGACGPYH